MAHTAENWDDEQRVERGARLAQLRESLGLTVLELADELNRVAAHLGVPQRWTGPKVAKIAKGLQSPTVDDVAVLAAYDPEQRGTFWWAFGRDEPKPSKQPDRKGDGKPVPAKRKRTG